MVVVVTVDAEALLFRELGIADFTLRPVVTSADRSLGPRPIVLAAIPVSCDAAAISESRARTRPAGFRYPVPGEPAIDGHGRQISETKRFFVVDNCAGVTRAVERFGEQADRQRELHAPGRSTHD